MAAIKDFRRSQLVLRRKCPAGRKGCVLCRKLAECGCTHHSAGASRGCYQPVGREDEGFPRGVARCWPIRHCPPANCFSAKFRRACRLIPRSSSSAPSHDGAAINETAAFGSAAAVHAYSDDGVSAVMRQPVIRERQIRGTNNVLGVAPINRILMIYEFATHAALRLHAERVRPLQVPVLGRRSSRLSLRLQR
jgi:hypothetical protein